MSGEKAERTCEQRIDEQLRKRRDELLPEVSGWSLLKCARHLKSEGSPIQTADLTAVRRQVVDVVRERARENLLSIDRLITYKLCLSLGGPADYFELDWSLVGGLWTGGRYVFQDWFDGASRPISGEQAAEIAEVFGIYPGFEFRDNQR